METVTEEFNLINFVNNAIQRENAVVITDRKFPATVPLLPAVQQFLELYPYDSEKNATEYSFTIVKQGHRIALTTAFFLQKDSLIPHLANARLSIVRYVAKSRKSEFLDSKSIRKKLLDEQYFDEIAKEDEVIVRIEFDAHAYMDQMEELRNLMKTHVGEKIHEFFTQKYMVLDKKITSHNIEFQVGKNFYQWNAETSVLTLPVFNQHGVADTFEFAIPKIPYTERDSYIGRIRFPQRIAPVFNVYQLRETTDYATKEVGWEPVFYVNKIYYHNK